MCQVVGPCAGVVRELPLRFEAQHAHPEHVGLAPNDDGEHGKANDCRAGPLATVVCRRRRLSQRTAWLTTPDASRPVRCVGVSRVSCLQGEAQASPISGAVRDAASVSPSSSFDLPREELWRQCRGDECVPRRRPECDRGGQAGSCDILRNDTNFQISDERCAFRRPSSRVPKGGQARESTHKTKAKQRDKQSAGTGTGLCTSAGAGREGVGVGTRAEHVALRLCSSDII